MYFFSFILKYIFDSYLYLYYLFPVVYDIVAWLFQYILYTEKLTPREKTIKLGFGKIRYSLEVNKAISNI